MSKPSAYAYLTQTTEGLEADARKCLIHFENCFLEGLDAPSEAVYERGDRLLTTLFYQYVPKEAPKQVSLLLTNVDPVTGTASNRTLSFRPDQAFLKNPDLSGAKAYKSAEPAGYLEQMLSNDRRLLVTPAGWTTDRYGYSTIPGTSLISADVGTRALKTAVEEVDRFRALGDGILDYDTWLWTQPDMIQTLSGGARIHFHVARSKTGVFHVCHLPSTLHALPSGEVSAIYRVSLSNTSYVLRTLFAENRRLSRTSGASKSSILAALDPRQVMMLLTIMRASEVSIEGETLLPTDKLLTLRRYDGSRLSLPDTDLTDYTLVRALKWVDGPHEACVDYYHK